MRSRIVVVGLAALVAVAPAVRLVAQGSSIDTPIDDAAEPHRATRYEEFVKPAIDATVGTLLLLASLWLIVLVAIAVRIRMGRGVIFKQARVGRTGRPFTMYKFRTMRIAPSGGASPITARNDSRVFPFGAFLRATKIDELPQLINVLTGDMTLVGPRPEAPEIVRRHYTPDDLTTLRVAPGVTSPGTVYYYTHCESILAVDSAVDQYVEELLPAKLALDRVYLRRATMLYDVRVILRTIAGIGARVVGSRRFPDPPELREAEGNEAPLPAKAHDSVGKTRTLTQ